MLPDRIRNLSTLLARLPGVGEKTAQRFALYFLSEGQRLCTELGRALTELPEHIGTCERCNNVAEIVEQAPTLCPVCRDSRRDNTLLCVVSRAPNKSAASCCASRMHPPGWNVLSVAVMAGKSSALPDLPTSSAISGGANRPPLCPGVWKP